MTLPALYAIAAEFRQQAAQLAELDLDDATLADTLESIQWPVEEKSRAVAAVIGNMDAAAKMVKDFAQRKLDEAKAMQTRADHLRKYLLDNMMACNITEIAANDGSLTIKVKSNPPAVIIDDESAIPDAYKAEVPAPPKRIDKKLISDALKAGTAVTGAHLERGSRLEIK